MMISLKFFQAATFAQNASVWVPHHEEAWIPAKVIRQEGDFVFVNILSDLANPNQVSQFYVLIGEA